MIRRPPRSTLFPYTTLHTRQDAEPGDQHLGHELAAHGGAHDAGAGAPLQPRHPLAHPHGDALLAIVIDQERGQVRRENARAGPRFRDEHGDVALLHPQGGGDLTPDEPATDHREADALRRERPQAAVIIPCVSVGSASWRAWAAASAVMPPPTMR